jgi:hypothetical protein
MHGKCWRDSKAAFETQTKPPAPQQLVVFSCPAVMPYGLNLTVL